MRYRELVEGKWWETGSTITLYHGTSSAFLPIIKKKGLLPPDRDLQAYAHEVLSHYLPKEKWKSKLLRMIDEHCVRFRGGYSGEIAGDRGSVIYCNTQALSVEGYAAAYAKHGGEIAYDVWLNLCVFLNPKDGIKNPPIKPRFEEAKPIVVELEVPRSWCIFAVDIDQYKQRLLKAWEDDMPWAREHGTVEEFLDEVMEGREIRVDRTVPPSMLKIVPISGATEIK